MFKGRITSRSNINGKVHTFQKDFDDYDTYQEFVSQNPEYGTSRLIENLWSPWSLFDRSLLTGAGSTMPTLPADTRYLPEGVDLDKYERRRLEKRQSEAEKAEKRRSLESTRSYLSDYLEENPDDTEAKDDLIKVEQELEGLK